MFIDERIIENGVTVPFLAKLIEKRNTQEVRLNTLRNYYEGKHPILDREKSSKEAANNKIVVNHAKYITDISTSYIAGNAIEYSPSEEYDIEAIKNEYLVQDIETLDFELEKTLSIYGRAYELDYVNEEGSPRSVLIEPEHAFVIYSDDSRHKPLLGIHYYKSYDENGKCTGVTCNTYDAEYIRTYTSAKDDWSTMHLENEEPHYFGDVPLFEYKNNRERQGDYEQTISLIDAYNTQMSDRVNDKENFVDSFLLLKGIEIDGEQAQKLKRQKILIADNESGDAKYLSDTMSESDIKILRDDIKDDIHRMSMVPDLSDESFANNTSGVAIKYKLITFEQNIKAKEKYLAKGLKQRFQLYNTILAIKNVMQIVPIHRVDVVFTHNLPVNNLENAQMTSYLAGRVSNETLISQLDFVTDAKEESKLAKDEQNEDFANQVSRVTEFSSGGGYGNVQD